PYRPPRSTDHRRLLTINAQRSLLDYTSQRAAASHQAIAESPKSRATCMSTEPHDTDQPAPNHIVAIRPGALGDALLLLPTLALLRRAFPASRLTLVTQPDVLPLASASGLADATSAYNNPEWSALFSDQPDDDAPARTLLNEADAIAWLT